MLRLKKINAELSQKERGALVVLGLLTTWKKKKEKKRKKKKRMITVLRAKRTLLCESSAEPGTGEAVDGWVEAHITTALPPHAGTETRRRNLYPHNHVHTSCGKSDGPRNRGGQESLCWWLCSERVPDPGGENNKVVTHTGAICFLL